MTDPKTHPPGANAAARSPAELFKEAERSTPESFAARHSCCFLLPLFDVAAGDSWVKAPQTVKIEPRWGDEPTGVTDLGEVRRQDEFGDKLFAVRKVQPVFPDMITVGRTANNDVVLEDSSVSKFHAHFRLAGGLYYLIDAESKNGTTLDGQRLAARRPVLVLEGMVVSFAGLRFRFLAADACRRAIADR